MRRGGRAALGLAAVLTLVGSACRFSDMNFVKDERIQMLSPEDRATVGLPFTLEWSVRDFEVGTGTLGGGGNYFAIFADRAPMAPGAHMRDLADKRDPCRRIPGCPDEEWLLDRFVFVSTETSMVIESLPHLDPDDTSRQAIFLHEITIVLMSGDNRRIGESAFAVEFFLEGGR